MIDRLGIRTRPPGRPIMHQRWKKLLFLHWRVPAEELRTQIPNSLEIDTYDGTAWIGVTPFTMSNLRPAFLPALPILSTSHELNVRTYVHADGIPGVWFFSLDASNPLAVIGARFVFGLPYFQAVQTLRESGKAIHFTSRRMHPGAPPANLDVRWTAGEPIGEAAPESLDFFLIERYCLYTVRGGTVFRARIHHRPWPLCSAALSSLESTMVRSHGITISNGEPLLHGQAAPLDVEVWPLEKL